MIEQTLIPQGELDIFKGLKNLNVIIDVGARTDTDYIDLWPSSEHHLFEPNPEFFNALKEKVKNRKNIFLNNYGLGSKEEYLRYNASSQTFMDVSVGPLLPIKTLNWYAKENNIQQVDFLKIDTEGFDLNVLEGSSEVIKHCRYIQYEHWDDIRPFHGILESDFVMCYFGWRNVLCIRKGEKWPLGTIYR